MKKLITGLALVGCSFGVLAEQKSLDINAGQQLAATAVKQLVLQEGKTAENFWFEVNPSQLINKSSLNVTGCAVSSNLSLTKGQLQVATKQMRCITDEGDIYTQTNFAANFGNSTGQVCTKNEGGCTEVTLYENSSYPFYLDLATSLEPELNVMREVNRARLMVD